MIESTGSNSLKFRSKGRLPYVNFSSYALHHVAGLLHVLNKYTIEGRIIICKHLLAYQYTVPTFVMQNKMVRLRIYVSYAMYFHMTMERPVC
jgi:hypothetical protein